MRLVLFGAYRLGQQLKYSITAVCAADLQHLHGVPRRTAIGSALTLSTEGGLYFQFRFQTIKPAV